MTQEIRLSDLPHYALQVVERVVSVTGKPFGIYEDSSLTSECVLRIADATQHFHQFGSSPKARTHRVHLVLKAALWILSVWQDSPEHRAIPEPCLSRLPRYWELQLRDLHPQTDESTVLGASMLIFNGMVKQLTTSPMEIRIEREIADQFPEHHYRQHAYLADRIADTSRFLRPRSDAMLPRGLNSKRDALNALFMRELCVIAGKPLPAEFQESINSTHCGNLDANLNATPLSGHASDRSVTDAWAKCLGMQKWFVWTPLEVSETVAVDTS